MEKELKIPTDRRKFFRQYVEILKPILKLRNREADVLAELLFESYKRKDINSLSDRFRLVFDYDVKLEMQERIKMESAQFSNCLTTLRKKNIIGKGNVINPGYLLNPDGESISFTFKFIFKDENSGN